MTVDGPEGTRPVEIPDDAIVVRQSNWAWRWAAVPWLVLLGATVAFDFITFGVLPEVVAAIFIVPRYMSYRNTADILTERYLIIQQGTFMGQRRFDLPIADVDDVLVKPGQFGRSLGYAGVNLQLKDGGMAPLRYVPAESPLVEHLRARMNP